MDNLLTKTEEYTHNITQVYKQTNMWNVCNHGNTGPTKPQAHFTICTVYTVPNTGTGNDTVKYFHNKDYILHLLKVVINVYIPSLSSNTTALA